MAKFYDTGTSAVCVSFRFGVLGNRVYVDAGDGNDSGGKPVPHVVGKTGRGSYVSVNEDDGYPD